MEPWIALAKGPLFRVALSICVLGLAYRLLVTVAHVARAWHKAGDRDLPLRSVVRATLGWIFPARLLSARPVYSTASLVFHLGILVVPLFLAGHVALLEGWLPGVWPSLVPSVADTLSVAALLMAAGLLLARLASANARALSRAGDIGILALILLVFLCGVLAAHPSLSPFGARGMLLAHILLADLALALTPLSKIAHCVLFPLTQLVFQLGWHFPAETGRHVALALGKENEPV